MRYLTKLLVCKGFLYKCYYDHEHCFEDISHNSCINIHQIEFYFVLSSALVLFLLALLLLKSHHSSTFFPISRQIRIYETFWKVPRQINAYVSNKWPLKLPCAYLNTQGSCTTGTPLIRTQGG
ncbi:hypothetical protein T12_16444 [Trichinella patagoniensis]|uniref:Uncharacterized protein n=1 Tax=Trichinella patagoniensis TaxID=990121 RepID=A0A0V1A8M4_9BILA|nr:hypothetical protein T12_16444 [Trichinella patagoniensis]